MKAEIRLLGAMLPFILSFNNLYAQLTFGSEQLISGQNGVVTVYAADFDNNGTTDLLSTSTQDGIRWWSNDGSGNFTVGQYLQQTGNVPLSLAAAIHDFDGDGDLDVAAIINTEVATSPTSIQYFENTGGGIFAVGEVLGFTGPSAQEIQYADVDSDGNQDLLYIDQADDEVGWIQNLGGGNWSSTILINTDADGGQSIAGGDFDGDGDTDIMVSGEFDDEWKWFANDGNENFGSATLIGSGNNPSSIAIGDLNNNGDIDGVSVYGIDGDVVWAENNGSGFDAPQFLYDGPGFPGNFPITVEIVDLDQDGDLDVVHCSILDNTINWFPNLGGGNFGVIEELVSGASNVRQMAFGDFDGDGDLDMAAANFGANELVWYENTSGVQVPGCTDPDACNFDPLATIDNGSCDYSCFGCTDPQACNFDPVATVDDGSCQIIEAYTLSWFGPTTFCIGDGQADIFDPEVGTTDNDGDSQGFVIVDEGGTIFLQLFNFSLDLETLDPGTYHFYSVNYFDGTTGVSEGQPFDGIAGCFEASAPMVLTIQAGGCADPMACNFDPAAECSLPICDFSCLGCTDETACNYDPAATVDDGSCDFSCLGCTEPLSCNYDPLATLDDGSCQLCDCTGCTDQDACNYEPDALEDDGSCFVAPPGYDCNGECIDVNNDGICDFIIIVGCTDDTAINYDPTAGEDDGSCIYGEDLCGEGTVWDAQSQTCVSTATCPGDINEDNIVNSSDLLQFLGVFGTPCE